MSSESRTTYPTLASVLAVVGDTVLETVAAPRGLELPVRVTVLEDPHDSLPETHAGLLLLVGVDAGQAEAVTAIRRAAARSFVAVVIKARDTDLSAVIAEAASSGVAVLAAADVIPWRHLDALLSAAIASVMEVADDQISTRDSELFSIANTVAAVIGGAVAIEDLAQNVQAYSNLPSQPIDTLRRRAILERRAANAPPDLRLYREVMSADGVVRFPPARAELARAGMSIRAGTLPLGTLWAILPPDGLGPAGEEAMIEGARFAALHMIRGRSAIELERSHRSNAVRNLLDETISLAVVWPRLGFRPGDRIALIAVGSRRTHAVADDIPLITLAAREIDRVCLAFRPDAVVTTLVRAVYVLVAGADAGLAALRLAGRIFSALGRDFPDLISVAVGDEMLSGRFISRARRQVDRILQADMDRLSEPGIATADSVQSKMVLLHLRDEIQRLPELTQTSVRRLTEHDAKKGSAYAASLTAWLDTHGDINAAAVRLHVHPNTLRYRLSRVREIIGRDLEDPDFRLAVWLQLRIDQLENTVASEEVHKHA